MLHRIAHAAKEVLLHTRLLILKGYLGDVERVHRDVTVVHHLHVTERVHLGPHVVPDRVHRSSHRREGAATVAAMVFDVTPTLLYCKPQPPATAVAVAFVVTPTLLCCKSQLRWMLHIRVPTMKPRLNPTSCIRYHALHQEFFRSCIISYVCMPRHARMLCNTGLHTYLALRFFATIYIQHTTYSPRAACVCVDDAFLTSE